MRRSGVRVPSQAPLPDSPLTGREPATPRARHGAAPLLVPPWQSGLPWRHCGVLVILGDETGHVPGQSEGGNTCCTERCTTSLVVSCNIEMCRRPYPTPL